MDIKLDMRCSISADVMRGLLDCAGHGKVPELAGILFHPENGVVTATDGTMKVVRPCHYQSFCPPFIVPRELGNRAVAKCDEKDFVDVWVQGPAPRRRRIRLEGSTGHFHGHELEMADYPDYREIAASPLSDRFISLDLHALHRLISGLEHMTSLFPLCGGIEIDEDGGCRVFGDLGTVGHIEPGPIRAHKMKSAHEALEFIRQANNGKAKGKSCGAVPAAQSK